MKRFFPLIICSLFLYGCVKLLNQDELSKINEINELKKDIYESSEVQSLTKPLDKTEVDSESENTNNTVAKQAQEIIEEYLLNDFSEIQEVSLDETKFYYLALGDSLTRGVGDEKQKNGYTKRLAEKIEQWSKITEVVLDNRGKRGRRSDQLLGLLEKGHYDSELRNSQLITITLGGNDIMKIVKKDIFELKKEDFDDELVDFQGRYDKIIKEIRLRNPDVPIVLIGLYNPFSVIADEITEFESIISEWNNAIQDVSENYENACFVNVEDLFNTNANLVYHSDFFHPSGNGYTIMTERIVSTMKGCNIEDQSNGLILFH